MCVLDVFILAESVLQLFNRSYWDSLAYIMHEVNSKLPVPSRLEKPAESTSNDSALQLSTPAAFERIGSFSAFHSLPSMQRLTANVR